MKREYEKWTSKDIVVLLNKLINKKTDSDEYRHTMYELGKEFGGIILNSVKRKSTIALASTVEDADYLAKGILEVLEENGKKFSLIVFWNKRFKPNSENNISVAPILREFHEKGYKKATCL